MKLANILVELRGDVSKAKWARRFKKTGEYVRKLENGTARPSKELLDNMLDYSDADSQTRRQAYSLLGLEKREHNQEVREYLDTIQAAGESHDGLQEEKFRSVLRTVLVDAGYMSGDYEDIVIEQVLAHMRG